MNLNHATPVWQRMNLALTHGLITYSCTMKCTLYKANFNVHRLHNSIPVSQPDSLGKSIIFVYLSQTCSMIQWTNLQNLSLEEIQPNSSAVCSIAGHHPCRLLSSSIPDSLRPPQTAEILSNRPSSIPPPNQQNTPQNIKEKASGC